MSTLVLDSLDAFGEVEKDRKPPVVGTTDTAVGINRHHQHPAFMFDESCDELLDGVWDSDFSENSIVNSSSISSIMSGPSAVVSSGTFSSPLSSNLSTSSSSSYLSGGTSSPNNNNLYCKQEVSDEDEDAMMADSHRPFENIISSKNILESDDNVGESDGMIYFRPTTTNSVSVQSVDSTTHSTREIRPASDGDSSPDSPISSIGVSDMETECFPCIPMDTASTDSSAFPTATVITSDNPRNNNSQVSFVISPIDNNGIKEEKTQVVNQLTVPNSKRLSLIAASQAAAAASAQIVPPMVSTTSSAGAGIGYFIKQESGIKIFNASSSVNSGGTPTQPTSTIVITTKPPPTTTMAKSISNGQTLSPQIRTSTSVNTRSKIVIPKKTSINLTTYSGTMPTTTASPQVRHGSGNVNSLMAVVKNRGGLPTIRTGRPGRQPILTPLISSQPKGSSGPLILTEEEKRTLISEGYPVPQRLPLSKQEEKSLKKIRRKIKNKISAQESRRKKKEYMDCLEKKMDDIHSELSMYKSKCGQLELQNQSLQKEVKKLQNLLDKQQKQKDKV